jgi:hypothetical protein
LGRHWFDSIMRHLTMFALLLSMLSPLRSALRTRADLALENLALRQQLANLRRMSAPPTSRPERTCPWERTCRSRAPSTRPSGARS